MKLHSITRRRVLQGCGVVGSISLAGCSRVRQVGLDSTSSDDAVAAENEPPSGESTPFEWESFEYSSLDPVFKRREWDDAGTVRIIESPEVEDILAVDEGEVSGFVEYVRGTDFAEEFVIGIDLVLPGSSFDFEIRDVIWESEEEVAIRGYRGGAADDSENTTILTAIRVPREDGTSPTAARVAVERGQPRDEEDDWRQLGTYPVSGYTGFSILMEAEDGELVAERYPSELTLGEKHELVYVIENYESESQEYSVVTQLQRVDTEGGSSNNVEVREELDRFTTEVDYGDPRPHKRAIVPTITGEDLRLVPLLYEGRPPTNPTKENAYRHLHLWVDVVT